MQTTFFQALVHYGGIFIALVVLVVVAWNLWVHYINELYLNSIDWVLLEIIPPKEVFKSPAAMELVLNSLYAGDATNWFKKYWVGELGQVFSLEIASIEGKIHFYIRFAKKFRKGFEAQLYAQYPQAQVIEAEDYTQNVPDFKVGGPISLFGYNVILAKDDPYPIKSYVDYGLDRAVGSLEEAERIDPITPLLEVMGSIGVGEQMWLQINMQKELKRHTVKDAEGKEEKGKSAKDKARAVIKELKEKMKIKDKEGKVTTVDRPTRGEQSVIESIERHMNKPGFDCGMRVIYLADKAHFNGDIITSFTGMLRQFGSEDLNSFKLSGLTKSPDEPWKDIGGRKANKLRKKILSGYKSRGFFYGSFKFKKLKTYFAHPAQLGGKPFLMSTEELATIWHLPGRVVETPTFTRLEAKKSEPPINLPV
ncbi:MAG TPA: hypothetical protein VG982_02605 [Candidatus Paceibacterota bacterium]|nr:hypothetical protein [Candidatus Paceibacterota bacterium]